MNKEEFQKQCLERLAHAFREAFHRKQLGVEVRFPLSYSREPGVLKNMECHLEDRKQPDWEKLK